MIIFKANGLSKKEEVNILSMLNDIKDVYQDAYITKNNIRLFINDNPTVFIDGLKKGDKIAYSDKGFAAVIGYSDKSPRKYLKFLTTDVDAVPALLKNLYWHIKEDLFCKVKANNPVKEKLMRNGFSFIGERGKEILLVHNYVARPEPKYVFVKDSDEEE